MTLQEPSEGRTISACSVKEMVHLDPFRARSTGGLFRWSPPGDLMPNEELFLLSLFLSGESSVPCLPLNTERGAKMMVIRVATIPIPGQEPGRGFE